MIKRYFLSLITCTCFYLLAASFTSKNGNYEVLKVTAPFPMQPIKVFIYPDKDFIITDFGAVNGGRVDNTKQLLVLLKRVTNPVADVLLFRQVHG